MDIRKDIIGNIPQIGDTIAFNRPSYKGLSYGIVLSFSKAGLPEMNVDHIDSIGRYSKTIENKYSPKTGFAVIKKLQND